MQNNIIRQTNGQKHNPAFTIVELLIVIVIIGILAAITIVSYRGVTAKANESALKAELSNANKKLAIYYAENGTYPASPLDGNGCPLNPVQDTQNCIKFNSDTTYTYTHKDSTSYDLIAAKGSLTYRVTESTSPDLAFPDSDWITIGNQRWAKKNLNLGTMVTGATAQTNNDKIEKYCYNNLESNCTTYGALYQWNEAMNYSTTEGAQGICPAGSHIPTDTEWKTLEMQLGMTQAQADTPNAWRGTDQGTQLKSGGTSGLNMPLAGNRYADGSFSSLSSNAYLWSSSEAGASAWYRSLGTSVATAYRYTVTKTYGYSVRCLGN